MRFPRMELKAKSTGKVPPYTEFEVYDCTIILIVHLGFAELVHRDRLKRRIRPRSMRVKF
jgi:hypothetical protein